MDLYIHALHRAGTAAHPYGKLELVLGLPGRLAPGEHTGSPLQRQDKKMEGI